MTSGALIDISQLFSWPARSGVQRLLLQLFRNWPQDVLQAQAGFEVDGHFHVVPLGDVTSQIEGLFADNAENAAAIFRDQLLEASEEHADFRSILALVDAYLLPEPTYDADTLERARGVCRSGRPTFALVMDALPALRPWLFSGRHQAATDPYFFFVAQLANVAFISSKAKNDVEQHLRRGLVPNPLVVTPGSDGLPDLLGTDSQGDYFVVLGTIEPRKATNIILDAAELLASDDQPIPLVVVGAPGGDERAIDRLTDSSDSVRWMRNASDAQVARTIRTARGMIFVGADEGFGLPPLEALHLGCPVVVSSTLPAVQDLPSWGQIRLSSITPESVAEAIRVLNRPSVNVAMREAIQHLSLPLWSAFSHQLASWMAGTIDRNGLE